MQSKITNKHSEEISDAVKNGSSDYSGKSILLSNGFAILLAVVQGWPLFPLLVVYWSQSVIIGGFNVARILKLQRFSTEGFTSNGRPVPENEKGKRSTASFFAMHFGIFHLVYLIFLAGGASTFIKTLDGEKSLTFELLWILFAVVGFLISHWFSYRRNVEADLEGRPNIGLMMMLPYLRVVPMHITIIVGGSISSGGWLLIIFMVLKTAADYGMHIAEHRIMRKLRKS
ncbi:DUF6498-containing protein [Verrucomicrobiales bacterium BCK34]|nr:DUF6498-containing protein [Verrucomicrobiales bacterium BCK34]